MLREIQTNGELQLGQHRSYRGTGVKRLLLNSTAIGYIIPHGAASFAVHMIDGARFTVEAESIKHLFEKLGLPDTEA